MSDILYCADFEDATDKTIISYYDGTTFDGLYNDVTGNAYLVKYNDEGFVKLFYRGKFTDGKFTGDHAFEVVLDENKDVNRYFIYSGSFTNGNRSDSRNSAIKYVTYDELKKILIEKNCPEGLKWYKN